MFEFFNFLIRNFRKPLELKKGVAFFGESLKGEILGPQCPICDKGSLLRAVPSNNTELFRYSCGTQIHRLNEDLFFAGYDEYTVLEDCLRGAL